MDTDNPRNLKVLHEMVMGQRKDSNFVFIQAYMNEADRRVQTKQAPYSLVVKLLYSLFPGEKDRNESPTLVEEVGSDSPQTKAFLNQLEKQYQYKY